MITVLASYLVVETNFQIYWRETKVVVVTMGIPWQSPGEWLGLGGQDLVVLLAGPKVQSLVRELRSCKPSMFSNVQSPNE